MQRIDPRLWRPLFDAVYEMNTAPDHGSLLSAVAAGIARLIPADHYNVHALDRSANRLAFAMLPSVPFTPGEIAYYQAHSSDHPVVAYYARTGDKHARRISDVMPTARWRACPFYRETSARLGFAFQMSLPIEVNATTVAGLTLNRRRRDFTRRHCALLDAFAPHFRLAWRRHADPWKNEPLRTPPARERLRQLGLTPREADVLFWMTEGKQNREIATILGRSLETVQEHVGNIVRKLGQENRHAATVFALRHLARD
ncbi:MAG TPA: helix-turn-helix domain-containing protein [Opitutus sp.]|nr:helix-turn-helix domain-containing protein [Opitutus sp.]